MLLLQFICIFGSASNVVSYGFIYKKTRNPVGVLHIGLDALVLPALVHDSPRVTCWRTLPRIFFFVSWSILKSLCEHSRGVRGHDALRGNKAASLIPTDSRLAAPSLQQRRLNRYVGSELKGPQTSSNRNLL